MIADGPARDELKQTFSTVAQEYARGRPRYAASAVAAMLEGLPAPASVIDLGAGSGQLSLPLAAAGARVTAVEPLATAAAILAATVESRPRGAAGHIEVLVGAAESIPLADHCADLVTCADSFHWFDAPVAVAEIVRTLRPGGRCCVSQLVPAWTPEQSGSWAEEISELVIPIWVAAQHPHNDGVEPTALAHPDLEPVKVVEVPFVHRTDLYGIVDYFSSMSVVAVLPDHEREAFRVDALAVLKRHQVQDIDLTYVARLWLSSRR